MLRTMLTFTQFTSFVLAIFSAHSRTWTTPVTSDSVSNIPKKMQNNTKTFEELVENVQHVQIVKCYKHYIYIKIRTIHI